MVVQRLLRLELLLALGADVCFGAVMRHTRALALRGVQRTRIRDRGALIGHTGDCALAGGRAAEASAAPAPIVKC